MKKVKLIDSDEEEEDQAAGDSVVKEREAIANELFEGADDAAEVLNQTSVNTTAGGNQNQVWKIFVLEG